jgi:HEAT repeat protein
MSRPNGFSTVALLCFALVGCRRSESTALAPPTASSQPITTDSKAIAGPAASDTDDDDDESITKVGESPAPPVSPTSAWLAKLGSDDRAELKAATDHFASLGDEALPLFLAHADDRDDDIRRGAYFGLFGQFDAANSPLVSAMVAALDDDDQGVRHIALESINKLPKKAFVELIPKIAPRLLAVNEPDPQLRAQIARMIARQKTKAQDALPALNQAVQDDPDFNVRSACLFAIYNVARNADEALPAPTRVLVSDRDPRLRRIAAERLGKYGAASAPAVPQLVAALADNGVPARAADDPLRGKDEPVCLAAAAALTQIGKPAVEALVQEITSENRVVRVLAIRALGDIGPAAIAAAPTLEKAVASTDSAEAAAARTALVKIRGSR